MDHIQLENLLKATSYDLEQTQYLVNGFKNGFDLGYRGPENIQQTSKNLKFTIGDKTELWNKVMKEVQLRRYAGPFDHIPYDNFIQSPIGLVPKDNGTKTRLIFHLSHPRDSTKGFSVNGSTPKELTTVSYPDFADAVCLCLQAGPGCAAGKSDMSSAFRHLAIAKKFWRFLVMKAQNPVNNKMYYFIDKCLPFGAAISCAHFQAFSNAVAHIVSTLTGRDNINYLDDFFFVALMKLLCDNQIRCFLEVCDLIRFPVAMDKTFFGSTCITFLGLLLDTLAQKVYIPTTKVEKAKQLINYTLDKKSKTIRLKKLQKLTGYLNFLCKCIVPGRVFTRRLYAYQKGVLKAHHHVNITSEMRQDLTMWLNFLENQTVYCRDFADFSEEAALSAEEISMFSDASANATLGCGGISDSSWFILQWNEEFINKNNPSINYLELYAVVIAVKLWIYKYKNKRVYLFCDNMSVVHMINNQASKCQNCMVLLRLLVLEGLIHNVKISAKHVKGTLNTYSDLLSRLKYDIFRRTAKKEGRKFNNKPDTIPLDLWPMEKIWKDN